MILPPFIQFSTRRVTQETMDSFPIYEGCAKSEYSLQVSHRGNACITVFDAEEDAALSSIYVSDTRLGTRSGAIA